MGCLLTILTLGIGGAVFANRRRRRQAELYHVADQAQLAGYDVRNMSCCERKQARRAIKAARKAERRVHRGGCCRGRVYSVPPQLVTGPMAGAGQRGMGADDTASEAVYTPRTDEFVHVDDIYSNSNSPPAYDDAAEGGRDYKDDEKKSITPV